MITSPLPGYSFRQIVELIMPAGALFATGFFMFADFRQDTNIDIKLLHQAQDVTENRVKGIEEQVRRQSDAMHGQREQLGIIEERTKNTQEDVSEIKALLNQAVRELRTDNR
jgi:hypothetical protein